MDEAAKKSALRMLPYGLYVVGTREPEVRDPATDLNAFIGSWVTQTSFKPPMLVVCVKVDSRSNRLVRASRALTLNILGADQKSVAAQFLKDVPVEPDGPTSGRMGGVRYEIEPQTGCPVFPDLPGWVACRVEAVLDEWADVSPDHTPFLVRVVDASFRGPDAPLTKNETGWVYAG